MKKRLFLLLSILFPTINGCITSRVYEEAVAKHTKIDQFTLNKACSAGNQVILKITGSAAGKKGDFDVFVVKDRLVNEAESQPIIIVRKISPSTSPQCPNNSTELPINVQTSPVNTSESIIQSTGTDDVFIYKDVQKNVKFKIEKDTHRPNLYKLFFTPVTFMADVVVSPILFIYLITNVGHIDG